MYVVLILINTYLKDKTIKLIKNLKEKKYLNALSILSLITLVILYVAGLRYTSYPVKILNLINTFKYVIMLIPLYLFLFIRNIQNSTPDNIILKSINLLLVGFVNALVMSVMPEFPYRSLFLSCTFIIIAVLMLLPYINIKELKIISIPIFVGALLLLTITLNFYVVILRSWNKDVQERIESSANSSVPTDSYINKAYYEIPNDALDVKLINNSNIFITDDDITSYSLN